MGNVVIIAVLAIIVALAIRSTVHRIRYGSACCGEREPDEKKIRVSDRNKRNYPNTYILRIDGMHCSNCARRVENAFNKTEGRWASADVGKKEVFLRSKNNESEEELRNIIASAGYTMLNCMKQYK